MTRDWEFTLDGKQHRFKLVHGMGRRRFYLDGNLLLEQKQWRNRQVSYTFDVEGALCEVNFHNFYMEYTGHYYSCFVNDVLIPSVQDKKWRRKIERRGFALQRNYWFELSKVLNLKPVPIHPELGYAGKPLLGDVKGFLTRINFGVSKENAPLVFALVRYKPVNDVKPIKNDLVQILSVAGILRKSSVYQVEPVAPDHALVSWFFNPKKLTAEQIAQSLFDVLAVFSRYTSGVSPFKCENTACKHPSDTNLKLVLVNGYPSWMCASCIAELDSLGERTKEDYKQAPLNFGRGLAAGILAAVAGSLAWAAMMILFDIIAAAFSAFILLGIVKAMDWVKAKRTFWSILIAGALSVGGSILGSYLGGLWTTVSKGGVSLTFIFESLENFLWYLGFVWNGLWEKTTVMNTTIMFSVLGVGIYLWSFWSQHRNQLKRAFKPEIYVVE
jgi:hypothetical protein